MKKHLLAVAVLALAPACARVQRLVVNTNVPGAQVYISKRGHLYTGGAVAGVVAVGTNEPYEDPPVSLGTAPLAYQFRVEETLAGVYLPGVAAAQKKICNQVLLQAYANGQYAEQVIPVNDGVAEVFLQLTPQPPPPLPPPMQPGS
jgi:hypothetical protein